MKTHTQSHGPIGVAIAAHRVSSTIEILAPSKCCSVASLCNKPGLALKDFRIERRLLHQPKLFYGRVAKLLLSDLVTIECE